MLKKIVSRSLQQCFRGSAKFPRQHCVELSNQRMLYHSYPDPTDVAKISEFKVEKSEKLIDKMANMKDFSISSDFRLDRQFPGVPTSKGVDKLLPPQTISSILPNGITVSSQELPTLMSSFAVLFTAGRF